MTTFERWAGCIAAAVTTLALTSCAASATAHRPPVVRLVQVKADGCGMHDVSTGFIVRPGLVMTVAHILHDATAITIDGIPATVVALDERMDAAILRMTASPDRHVEFADPTLSADNSILRWTAGRAERIDSVTITTVATIDYSDLRLKTRWLREGFLIDHESRGGDSGAPIVDQGGRVVGMLFASRTDGGPQGFALNANELQSLLAAGPSATPWVPSCG